MSLVATVAAVALDGTAAALLGWTTWTAFQARDRPSARSFLALSGALTVWALFTLGQELFGASPGVLGSVAEFGQIGVALLLPGVLVLYALSYTGRGTGMTRWRIVMFALIALPVAASVVYLYTGPSNEEAIIQVLGPIIGTELMFLVALFGYGTYLLIGIGRRHDRLSGVQMPVLVLGVAAPYLSSTIGNPGSPADGVTLGLLVSGAVLAVAVRRYPVMTGFPKTEYVARTRVVDALQEAVVVIDWDDHVLDANTRTAELFDRSTESMIGEPIQSVVDGVSSSDLAAGATETVTLRTTRGRRQFQFSVSAVDARADDAEPVARAVLFRDVTDRQTREQRLEVLNRVLRHNVRNELDVVLAYADRIEDDAVRAGIRESATDLVELGDKAREAEEVMTASGESPEPVDLVAVADHVAEQYPEGEVALDCPEALMISSHRSVLQQVLTELVDNALSHTDGATPGAEIRVREAGDAVELSVADDGPGIPERERWILAEGTETQLEHARGIGLWFVNWAVTQLGGELAFDDAGVVTIRLYDAEYATDPDASA